MGKRLLNEEQIIDVIWGTTLMAGGGGGALMQAVKLLEKFKETHPEKAVELWLYDVDELDSEKYAAVIAGIGAPTAGKKTDITSQITGAYEGLMEMTAGLKPPIKVEYAMAVELGGANTFIPMLVCLMYGIPFVDADGAGRACPAMHTMLLGINGCNTAPVVMSDSYNNRVTICTDDPKNAEYVEEIARSVCTAFGMTSVMGGWLSKKHEIKQNLPEGTITQSEKIGRIMRECASDKREVFKALADSNVLDCKFLCKGRVVKIENVLEHGFDYGTFVLDTPEGTWRVGFQNESLVIFKEQEPVMTIPDIICAYDYNTGMPLTNADIIEGMELVIGIARADEKWWNNPKMFDIWKPFLKRVGYEGENKSYSRYK